MRFFAVSAIATLAFGLFAAAAPTPDVVDLAAEGKAHVKVLRRSAPAPAEDKCLDSILGGVISEVTEIVGIISKLEGEITKDVLEPILTKVEVILTDAVEDVEGLVGLAENIILKKLVGGLLDASGLAGLLCEVIRLVLKIVTLVLSIVSSLDKADVLSILLKLVSILCDLLSCVLKLVEGLLSGVLGLVVGLIKDLLPIIISLKLDLLIKVLCIQL